MIGSAIEEVHRPEKLFTEQETCHFMSKGFEFCGWSQS